MNADERPGRGQRLRDGPADAYAGAGNEGRPPGEARS